MLLLLRSGDLELYCNMNYPWIEYIRLTETDSTNTQAKLLAGDKEITLVCAEFQAKGRGQIGNSWESEYGQNLLFSLFLHPNYVVANEQFFLSQAISLAIQQSLAEILNTNDVCIKWPNDIYWKDKKICGILIENTLVGKKIEGSTIGVGLNVNQIIFKSSAPNPVSMRQICGVDVDRLNVLRQIVTRFYGYLDRIKLHDVQPIVSDYFENLYRKEGYFSYRDKFGEFEAKIVDVEPMGHLVLCDEQGQKRKYAFKEVEYII